MDTYVPTYDFAYLFYIMVVLRGIKQRIKIIIVGNGANHFKTSYKPLHLYCVMWLLRLNILYMHESHI